MSKYTVAIVDDHILIAKAISGIIDKFPKYTVLYEAENGKAVIEKFKQPKNIPDIVLLDITMPVMDGFETAKWISRNHPEVLILSLSMQDDEQSVIKMIKSGAKGYLLKNIQPAELEKALDALVTKGFYYQDWAASKIFMSLNDEEGDSKPSGNTFTEREIEFLGYCCTELTYREIADQMHVSNRTVEGYRDALFEKLGFKTRVGLAMFAVKNGYCA